MSLETELNKSLISVIYHLSGTCKELADALEKAEKETLTDGLTGLLNRKGFTNIKHNISGKTPWQVAVVDIDYFKKYNDDFGHFEGDKALMMVANNLDTIAKTYTLIGVETHAVRWGGEEFVIVTKGTPQDISDISEHLCKTMPQKTISLPRSITVSIGCAQMLWPDWTTGLKLADERLYQAKLAGRNRVVNGSEAIEINSVVVNSF